MQVLIMGCGRVGAIIATSMAAEGHKVCIIDPNPDNFRRLPTDLLDNAQIVPVIGDGIAEHHLRKAQIEKADVFVAVSGPDTQNALAAQIAQHIFGVPKVVCRINDPGRQEMYTQLGLTVVSPTNHISEMVLEAVRQ